VAQVCRQRAGAYPDASSLARTASRKVTHERGGARKPLRAVLARRRRRLAVLVPLAAAVVPGDAVARASGWSGMRAIRRRAEREQREQRDEDR
jgi:hypothetical protein